MKGDFHCGNHACCSGIYYFLIAQNKHYYWPVLNCIFFEIKFVHYSKNYVFEVAILFSDQLIEKFPCSVQFC